jgi:orotidine-5'-phosphate decarboxylase
MSTALLREASIALSDARGREPGAVARFHQESDREALARRADLESDLFGALKDGGITILFQPQASLSDGVVGGVEALSRWDHPLHGRLSAVTLLETAASAELALAVGRHIRSRAIATAAAWTGALANLKISLNVTAADLADPEFIDSLAKDLASSGLSPRRLVIEVTEEAIINDLDAAAARRFIAQVRPELCRLKVGKELFVAAGPAFVEELVGQGYDVFLDLKFHDIPNTVAQACKAAAGLGVWMINVHASGGPRMLAAAREALEGVPQRPLLIAVTVLTSMGADELKAIGVEGDAEQQVLRLAGLTRDAGLDGVVCSAREAAALRQEMGPAFCLVTPGIRPTGSDSGDHQQHRCPRPRMCRRYRRCHQCP